jgi:hypothetical protein
MFSGLQANGKINGTPANKPTDKEKELVDGFRENVSML